jgi:hypothetical protein
MVSMVQRILMPVGEGMTITGDIGVACGGTVRFGESREGYEEQ